MTLGARASALRSTRNRPRAAVQGCVLGSLCVGDPRRQSPSKETTDERFGSSALVLWAWLALNQRPHPDQRSTDECHEEGPPRWHSPGCHRRVHHQEADGNVARRVAVSTPITWMPWPMATLVPAWPDRLLSPVGLMRNPTNTNSPSNAPTPRRPRPGGQAHEDGAGEQDDDSRRRVDRELDPQGPQDRDPEGTHQQAQDGHGPCLVKDLRVFMACSFSSCRSGNVERRQQRRSADRRSSSCPAWHWLSD
jgi:hypothetical protein